MPRTTAPESCKKCESSYCAKAWPLSETKIFPSAKLTVKPRNSNVRPLSGSLMVSPQTARFGLTVTFQRPEKARFEVILTELAKQHGIEMPHDQLLTKAEAFAIRAGGRSPRVAKQFIEQCAAGVQK